MLKWRSSTHVRLERTVKARQSIIQYFSLMYTKKIYFNSLIGSFTGVRSERILYIYEWVNAGSSHLKSVYVPVFAYSRCQVLGDILSNLGMEDVLIKPVLNLKWAYLQVSA